MKICIPTLHGTGVDDALCDHFGSAPWFTIVDTDSDQVTVVRNDNRHHAHGTCHPLAQLSGHKFDAIVVAGVGRRALQTLQAQGLRVLRAEAPTVKAALEQMRQGQLTDYTLAHACGGHGHGHGHGMGLGTGRGRVGRGGGA